METVPIFNRTIRSDEITITQVAGEQLTKLFDDIEDDEIEAVRI